MSTRYIKPQVLKALFAKSGNQCAFPGCNHPIFNEDNTLIAQVCHIEAVSEKGQRYNSGQSDSERNGFGNLMLMCYRHHKETDDIEKYKVELLKEIKKTHEANFKEAEPSISDNQLAQLVNEINEYWRKIDFVNQQEHIADEFKIDIDSADSAQSLINQIEECILNISSLNDGLSEELKTKVFETVCLGIPNNVTIALSKLKQLKVKELEQRVLINPENEDLQFELLCEIEELEEIARTAGIAD